MDPLIILVAILMCSLFSVFMNQMKLNQELKVKQYHHRRPLKKEVVVVDGHDIYGTPRPPFRRNWNRQIRGTIITDKPVFKRHIL